MAYYFAMVPSRHEENGVIVRSEATSNLSPLIPIRFQRSNFGIHGGTGILPVILDRRDACPTMFVRERHLSESELV